MARNRLDVVFEAAASRGTMAHLATPVDAVPVPTSLRPAMAALAPFETFGGLFTPAGAQALDGLGRGTRTQLLVAFEAWIATWPARAVTPVELPAPMRRVNAAKQWFADHGIDWAFDRLVAPRGPRAYNPPKLRHALVEDKQIPLADREEARARVQRLLGEISARNAEMEQRAALDAPPALSDRVRRLSALRRQLRAATPGYPPLGPPVVQRRGLLAVGYAAATPCAGCYSMARDVTVGTDDVRCPGRPDHPCPLRADAVDWAIEALRGTFGPSYRERLDRPQWMDDLEGLHVTRWPRRPYAPPAEITWQITDGRVRLVPLGPDREPLPEHVSLERLDLRDRLLISVLRRDTYHLPYLRELAGHPRVLDPRGRPVEVRAASVALWIGASDVALRAELRVDGVAVDPTRLAFRQPIFDDGRVTVVDLPPRVHDEVVPLLEVVRRLPPEAAPGLLAKLASLGDAIPLDIDPAIAGPEIAAEDRPTLHFAQSGDGVSLSMYVRPVSGGPAFAPGSGTTLVVRTDGPVAHVRRDLARERERAEAVIRALSFGTAGVQPRPHVDVDDDGWKRGRDTWEDEDDAWEDADDAWEGDEGDDDADDQTDDGGHAASRVPAPPSGSYAHVRLSGPDDTWEITTADELAAVLRAVDALGDQVLVTWDGPKRRLLRPLSARDLTVGVTRTGDWLRIGGDAEVDGVLVALEKLLGAAAEGRRMFLVEGGVVEIEPSLAAHLGALARIAGPEGRLPRLAAGELAPLVDAGVAIDGPPDWLRTPQPPAAVPVPAGFQGTLRDYQRDGLSWLASLAAWAPGALLCDDMGLGKTLQSLAFLLSRPGPALVVAPASVVDNWRREAATFAPSLRVLVHQGDRRRPVIPVPGDLVLTSWDLLVRDAWLADLAWDTVVLDEAHVAKNPESKRAQAARGLNAGFRLALTGTPLENRLSDLWSLASIAVPGLLPAWDGFRARFAIPIERDKDEDARRTLVRLLQPFLLRRTKAMVAKDLPPREEILERLALSAAERSAYDRERIKALALLETGGLPPQQRRFEALAALTRLRQLACDPALVDPQVSQASTKIARLVERVGELREEGRRALVFSSFTRLLDRAEAALRKVGVRVLRLDGGTPIAARPGLVQAFQAGEADVFLISLKAGGTGLNLTAADTVLHLDPWWNPAAEAQAADRAHRIGQTRPVTVYRLVAADTVEEGVLAMQADKRALVAAVLDDAPSGAVSIEELRALLLFGRPSASAPSPFAEARGGAVRPPAEVAARSVAAKAPDPGTVRPTPLPAASARAGRAGAGPAPAVAPESPWDARQFQEHLLRTGRAESTARVYTNYAAAFMAWLAGKPGVDDPVGEWLRETGRPSTGPAAVAARAALKLTGR